MTAAAERHSGAWDGSRTSGPVSLPILPGGIGEGTRYLNRELSWLQFDERVLAMAEDPSLPLLERIRFAAIFSSNLDEFFQVRVAGLKQQRLAEVSGTNADSMTPAEQLAAIREQVIALTARHSAVVEEQLLPALGRAGVHTLPPEAWSRDDDAHLERFFEDLAYPVLTPLAVDPAHPFPYISDLSLNFAVLVESTVGSRTGTDVARGGPAAAGGDPSADAPVRRFARVKVPPVLPRLVPLPGTHRYALLEDVIASRLDRLFPGVRLVGKHLFRVTRNADLEIAEDEADDLLLAIESELNRRRFGRAVRLEVAAGMDAGVRDLLVRWLGITADDVYEQHSLLGGRMLMALSGLDLPHLKLPPHAPVTPHELDPADDGAAADVFAVVRRQDVLVHHPYDSFRTSTQAFLEQAARDPAVVAIKITLYRTSGPGSPIVRALLDAANSGKQVVALVELRARFDEAANIGWARTLEEAGVHVAYGVVGLKTHTKVALVVRSEGGRLRRYVHIGTGNYNESTARAYEDFGLLSSDAALGADVSDLFNVLTGYARQDAYRRLVVAPDGFRSRIQSLIEREAAEPDGHIMIKVNALVDPRIIDLLYDAAQAGARVDLIVRGICCLRPGVPGLSEGIVVRSILGRYLEHSRIYRFGSPARGFDHLIGSGDLMPRNLDRRVEALVPVTDPAARARLEEALELAMSDDQLAWELGPDARWRRAVPTRRVDSQAELERRAVGRAASAGRARP